MNTDLAKTQRWPKNVSTSAVLAGISIIVMTASAVSAGTVNQNSSEADKLVSIASLWVLTQIPSVLKSAVESEREHKLYSGVSRVIWLTFAILTLHVFRVIVPELGQIVFALAGFLLSIPASFAWSAFGAFVGVALATVVFRRK